MYSLNQDTMGGKQKITTNLVKNYLWICYDRMQLKFTYSFIFLQMYKNQEIFKKIKFELKLGAWSKSWPNRYEIFLVCASPPTSREEREAGGGGILVTAS